MRMDVRQKLEALRKPAIHLVGTDEASRSWLGGIPKVHEPFVWPEYKGKPMAFLCQINLSDLPRVESPLRLPSKGVLCVFYDQAQSTWGSGPEDFRSWKLIYDPEEDGLKEPAAPDSPTPKPVTGWRKLLGLKGPRGTQGPIYPRKNISFEPIMTYPPLESDELGKMQLEEEDWDEISELSESVFGAEAQNQLFGYPAPEQGNQMEMQCQLVSNGIRGNWKDDPRYPELSPGAPNWHLLLQIGSDDDVEFCWGDVGKLYFWMKEEDADALRFDRVWIVLQCG